MEILTMLTTFTVLVVVGTALVTAWLLTLAVVGYGIGFGLALLEDRLIVRFLAR